MYWGSKDIFGEDTFSNLPLAETPAFGVIVIG
jgi:hypothetical protein